MSRVIFKFGLFILLFVTIAGSSICKATCYFPSGDESKYLVSFGESYHNYLPGSIMQMGVVFKNNSSDNLKVSQELALLDSSGVKVWKTVINLDLVKSGSVVIPLLVPVPKFPGIFTLTISETPGVTQVAIPSFEIEVIQPKKSERLSKILVHTPDWEEGINKFLKSWDIKAPTIAWGQVLLLGKKGWMRYADGDQDIIQLVDRALRREMSVIFIDFDAAKKDSFVKKILPFGVSVSFVPAKSVEKSFVLKSNYKELTYGFTKNLMKMWNGYSGVTVPVTDLLFEGKGLKINALATAGKNPYRYPVVELIPLSGKGKLYLSQVITEGRLDETVKPPRNQPGLPAYDPVAVQFLLNLISETVGDNLLK